MSPTRLLKYIVSHAAHIFIHFQPLLHVFSYVYSIDILGLLCYVFIVVVVVFFLLLSSWQCRALAKWIFYTKPCRCLLYWHTLCLFMVCVLSIYLSLSRPIRSLPSLSFSYIYFFIVCNSVLVMFFDFMLTHTITNWHTGHIVHSTCIERTTEEESTNNEAFAMWWE